MIKIWIVDDDKDNADSYTRLLEDSHPEAEVKWFECLYDAFQCEKHVDYIFIDLSAVDGRTLPCFDNYSYIGNLRRFVEKHLSSFIVIVSALMSHAREDVEDLQEACPDAMLFALDVCGREGGKTMGDFISRYSEK